MYIESLLATAPTPVPLTVGGHSFRMVPVPGGKFRMGDEVGDLWEICRPVHEVQLSDFWVGQFPVTQALWKAVTNNGDNPSFFKGDNRPVEMVSWEDIDKTFLPELNKKLPDWNFRLPTEAEWEFIARGGSLNPVLSKEKEVPLLYPGSGRLDSISWLNINSHSETKPVGLKLPNALGLFELSGNVMEWCADCFDENFYKQCAAEGTVLNPLNRNDLLNRIVRGGSWFDSDRRYCRVGYRFFYNQTECHDDFGFRLAASPSSSVVVGL